MTTDAIFLLEDGAGDAMAMVESIDRLSGR